MTWRPEQWQLAQDMRAAGETYGPIARALGLTYAQVAGKFHYEDQQTAQPAKARDIEAALDRRDARLAALNRRTFTATVFGDPPPGYSALDQMQARGS